MKHKILLGALLAGALSIGYGASDTFAQVWKFYNGGAYYTQYGSTGDWFKVSNDGWCVSGRGTCGSSLWYYKWTHGNSGCSIAQNAIWNWAGSSAVKLYPGDTYAWIDSSSGTAQWANYSIAYNYGSADTIRGNQNAYSEGWMPLGVNLYRSTNAQLDDSGYGCASETTKEIEFDEIKLEI